MTLFFHLLHRADSVDVFIVDSRDRVVRTLASGVPAAIKQNLQYRWNGRLADGTVAARGLYNFRITLIHQRRTIDPVIPGFPIMVQSMCPPP